MILKKEFFLKQIQHSIFFVTNIYKKNELHIKSQFSVSIEKLFSETHAPVFGIGVLEKFQDYKISLGRVRVSLFKGLLLFLDFKTKLNFSSGIVSFELGDSYRTIL